MWKRANDIQSEVWHHTSVLELNLPSKVNICGSTVRIFLPEKSNTLFIIDERQGVHKIDVETGMVEEQQFQNALSTFAVPLNIEWPTLFASRLG